MTDSSNSISKTAIFWLIACLIPLIVLCVLEFSLRAVGFGDDRPLFVKNPTHADYMLAEPSIITRYFPKGYAPPVTLEPTFFLSEKPDNGFRVVVQGGSTAAGFPYGLGASLAGMLDSRLRQSLPGRHVEVVNLAMSAVNSYFLLDTADEVLDINPDMVVIYAGHNEYLGIFGVGSSFSAFQQPLLMAAFLQLRHLAIIDAIQQLFITLQQQQSATTSGRTLMSQIARHKAIPKDSELYQSGLVQFENNMRELVTTYTRAGIPVVIATIASNVKDQKPFASGVSRPNAQSYFAKGRNALAAKDGERALEHLINAKDADELRFRAPEAINKIIKNIANENDLVLADVERAMQARSEYGIIGNNLMLEHLHPNVPGYFILANTVFDAIVDAGFIDKAHAVDVNLAWQQRPLTPAEEYYGFAHVRKLMSDYPFTDTPQQAVLPPPADWQQQLGKDYFDGKLDWLTMMQNLRQGYQQRNDSAMWLKTTLLLADALPHDPVVNSSAADALRRLRKDTQANYYLERAKRAGLVELAPTKKVSGDE